MNDKKNTTEYGIESANELFDINDLGVTEAELAAADRLLAAVAEHEDAKVDYSGMLRRIKAAAMEQGLAAKINGKKSKEAKRRRILRYAASAAALLVVGLGVFGVVKAMVGSPKNADVGNISAVNDDPANETAATESSAVKRSEQVGDLVTSSPVKVTEAPAFVTQDTNLLPLPTEASVRGGIKGYTYIEGFDTPNEVSGLYPDGMPDYMQIEPFEEGLGYIAKGYDEQGQFRFITCRLEPASESDLPAGVASYTVKTLGGVAFVWRIDEKSCMYVDFEGFDYAEALAILQSYTPVVLAA